MEQQTKAQEEQRQKRKAEVIQGGPDAAFPGGGVKSFAIDPPLPIAPVAQVSVTPPPPDPPSGPDGARLYALAAAKLCEVRGVMMDQTRLNAVRMLKAAVALLEG